MSLVELDRVSRHFGSSAEPVVALHDISFALSDGELVGVFGPSGSGKTTLLNIVVGWDNPTSGTVARSPEVSTGWSGMAIVHQDLGLMGELTAMENIELAVGVSQHAKEPKVLFEQLGLDPSEIGQRRPDQLSLGQQQRVAIIRALVAAPRLLVADEPTAHQDEENADLIFDAFRHLVDDGTSILVSTHDPRLLSRLDRSLEVSDGRLQPGEDPG